MFTLTNLLWLLVAGTILVYWWHSGSYKGRARNLAVAHCQQLNLQLLDQSIVIIGIWLLRTESNGFTIRRTYQFEFTSTGEHRYQGVLVLAGMHLKSIELDTYKIPEVDRGDD